MTHVTHPKSDAFDPLTHDPSTHCLLCKRVLLDLLQASYLRLSEVVIQRITVITFGMNDGGGNGRSCFGVEVRADASKLTNMVIA